MRRKSWNGGRPDVTVIAPAWAVAPAVTTYQEGVAGAYSAGTVGGNPTPAVVYAFLLDDVSQGASFTPQSGDAGKTLKIRGTATNVAGSAVSTSAGVVIAAAASAPSWSVAPAVTAYQENVAATYSAGTFTGNPTPTASYVFLLDDVSQGASFTPQVGDAGKTLKVRGTATNSQGSTDSTSAGQTIAAAASGSATATITWAQRVDSSNNAITTDGFKVYYGQTQYGPYPYSVSIANGSLTTTTSKNGDVTYTYTITGLTAGTWYVAIATVDASGESDPSNELTVTAA